MSSDKESHHFTKEGIMLGMFKLTVETHAMMRTMFRLVSDLYRDMPPNPNRPGQEAAFESMREQYEQAGLDMSKIYEALSIKAAHDFAVDHDSNLDDNYLDYKLQST